MYQKHYQMIKELEALPFWVRSLTNQKYVHLHFWILQLVYTAINIPFPEYAKANFKMFKKANGMSALFGILNTAFKELTPPEVLELSEEVEQLNQPKMSNFTGIRENLSYFERNSVHINKSIVALNIIDHLYTLVDDANCIPLPSFLQYLSKKRSINILTQLLLIENNDLTKVLLNFFLKHSNCHFTLSNLLENGIVECLMLTLHTKNGRKALTILDRINEFTTDFNDDIDYHKQASKEEQATLSKLDHQTQIKIKNSLLCRFLPTTLLDMYVSEDKKTFLEIYKHDDIQNEYIIWNSENRDHMLSTLRKHFEPQIMQLVEFSEKEFDYVKVPGNFPFYSHKFSEMIQYESLDKELKIGKFFAKMWVKNVNAIQMTNEDLDEFYNKVANLIKKSIERNLNSEDILTIEEGVQNLTLCTKMVMKLNDVFNYKKIVDLSMFDQIILIEEIYPNNHYVWD